MNTFDEIEERNGAIFVHHGKNKWPKTKNYNAGEDHIEPPPPHPCPPPPDATTTYPEMSNLSRHFCNVYQIFSI